MPFISGYLSTFWGKIEFFSHFLGKKFGGMGKSSYICSVRDVVNLKRPALIPAKLSAWLFYMDYLIPLDAKY